MRRDDPISQAIRAWQANQPKRRSWSLSGFRLRPGLGSRLRLGQRFRWQPWDLDTRHGREGEAMAMDGVLWGYSLEFWSRWSFRLLILGLSSGVFALLVSLLSSYISSQVSAVVRQDADIKLSSSRQLVAERQGEAARANERVATLERDAAQANERAALANQRASELAREAEQLSQSAEAAKAAADQARAAAEAQARAALTDALSDRNGEEERTPAHPRRDRSRRLRRGQHAALVDTLRGNPGVLAVESMSDSETGLFAADLIQTFLDAGWRITETTFPVGEIWTGLSLVRSRDSRVEVVGRALREAEIPFSVANRPPRDPITLRVGGQPPLFQG